MQSQMIYSDSKSLKQLKEKTLDPHNKLIFQTIGKKQQAGIIDIPRI